MTQNEQNQNTGSCCTDQEQAEHHIAEGTTTEFDVAQGALKFEGVLFNKGKIVFKSSNPDRDTAELAAIQIMNEGEIVSEVPNLKITATILKGEGIVRASGCITVKSAEKNLAILGNTFRSKELELLCDGILQARPHEVEGRIDYTACAAMVGVQSGNLHIGRQTLSGDPIYFNRGGDVSISSPPTDGSDVFALAHGNITCGSLDVSSGMAASYGRIAFATGIDFDTPSPDVTSNLSCADCLPTMSDPAIATVGVTKTGSITVTGNLKARTIGMTAETISITGNIEVVKGNPVGHAGFVALTAWESLEVTGTITAEDDDENDAVGSVALQSPQINLSSKVTASVISLQTVFEEEAEVLTGSVVTADLEGRVSVGINAGGIQLSCGGGGFRASVSQGVFSIETGDITSEGSVGLYATSSIATGAILLNENDNDELFAGHDVRIHAHVDNESPAAMNIGSGGISSITVHGTVDQPGGFTNKVGVIFLSNGSGDINLDGDAITVSNEQDGTPSLLVSSGDGTLTLTGGGLIFDGTSNAPAGSVILHGAEIVVSAGFAISANSTVEDPEEFPPQVAIVTDLLTLSGDLSIECNGNTQTSISFAPKDGLTINPTEMQCLLRLGQMIPNAADADFVVSGAGNLEATANSQGGYVNVGGTYVEFDAGTVDLTSLGEFTGVNFNYNGSPGGVDSLAFLGGKVTVTVNNPEAEGGNITIATDQIEIETEVELNANSVGGEIGGSVNIFTYGGGINGNESGSLTITANGEAAGQGGSVTLNSAAGITGEINIAANGGESGDGGIITIGFSSEEDLNVKNLSATAGSENGGNITITNNAGSNLIVNVTGVIDTNAAAAEEELAGSTTLMVSDDEAYSISLNILEGGGFNSLITAEGAAVNIDAEPVVKLGINSITANDGDVEVTASASCVSCLVNGVHTLAANSVIGLHGPVYSNGAIRFSGVDVYSKDQASDTDVLISASGAVTILDVSSFSFGERTYIDGGFGDVTIHSNNSPNLHISVKSGGGIRRAQSIYIGSGPEASSEQSVTIDFPEAFTGTLRLQAHASLGTAQIYANGSLTCDCFLGNFNAMTGDINTDWSPDRLVLFSANSSVVCALPVAAIEEAVIQNGAEADVQVTGVRVGDSSTTPGAATLTSGRDLIVGGLTRCYGPVDLEAGRALAINNSIAAITGGTTASITAEAVDDITVADSATLSSYGDITLDAGDVLFVDSSAHLTANALTGNGNLILKGGSALTCGSSVQLDAKGEIRLSVGRTATKTNVDPGSRPGGVSGSQVHLTGASLYWGNSIALTGSGHDFTANGKDLVFDGNSLPLTLGASSTFNAHS